MKNLIVEIAQKRFVERKQQVVEFTKNQEVDKLLNNLEKYPHLFVLACLADKQIKAQRAWIIPYEICKELPSFEFYHLEKLTLEDLKEIFNQKKLHRFNDKTAEEFYKAIADIRNKYNGVASNIWNNNPSSATVVYRFLEFEGIGVKISTMAANILAREFKIHFSDYYSIDISPDVHIVRVMKRMGFVSENANRDMIIYKARELNPDYPGIIDPICWEIGTTWCSPQKMKCSQCIVENGCQKINLVNVN